MRLRLAIATLLAGALATTALPAAAASAPNNDEPNERRQAFVHPGVLVDRQQLEHVRRKLRAGAEPWTTAYYQMRTSTYASLAWTPRPRELVECGPYSNPNLGCTEERTDALAAYTHALLWYLTKDRQHAEKAIEIMDAWSAVLEGHTNHNAALQAGWSAASWTRAAELIKHTYHRWSPDRIERFNEMLRTIYLPPVLAGKPNYNGNWDLIMLDAAIGIGVFLDDRRTFDAAIAKWRQRVPAYIYLESDGPLPYPPPGGTKDTPEEIIEYWHDQTTFVDGLAQETCRDFGHTGWGFEGATHVAETAWIQGVDLYSEMRERMTKALEFHAKYDLGEPVPAWLCGGTLKPGLGPVLEIAYNHYTNREGLRLPKTGELLTRLRPTGTSHFLGWETLTHAMNP